MPSFITVVAPGCGSNEDNYTVIYEGLSIDVIKTVPYRLHHKKNSYFRATKHSFAASCVAPHPLRGIQTQQATKR